MQPPRHAVLIHPTLGFSGLTERMLATARVLEGQGLGVTILSTPGARRTTVENTGFAVRFAELPSDPWRAPFATLRTRKLLERLEPDVVHATADSLAPLVSTITPRLGVPWIQELHAPARGPVLVNRRHFATAIVSSDSLIESVVNHGGIPRAEVRVIKNAPQPGDFGGPRPFQQGAEGDLGDHGRTPRIGCSGFLDEHHATSWFLEAVRLMVLSGTRAHFLILGEGPQEGALRRAIREAGLTERVTVAVPTTPSAAESLAALDLHVSCKTEGGPGWLARAAMAQGVPSVFLAAGDAYDLIEDKSSGILVEAGNARRLADELTLLLSQPGRARRMGSRGRERQLEDAPPQRFEYEVAETYALALGTAVTGV
jgi:glycosyltransferase involved in cell wall biosynthesis